MDTPVILPTPLPVRAFVFGDRPGDRYRAGRTVRALREAGVSVEDVCGLTGSAVADTLNEAPGPVWLLRAGAWPVFQPPVFPPSSATGRALCALGGICPEPGASPAEDGEVRHWAKLQAETGGDFSQVPGLERRLPPLASAYLEAVPAAGLAGGLAAGKPLAEAVRGEIATGRLRVVRYHPLDVYDDPALRVAQVVTSLQQGGAERIALDLTRTLGKAGVRTLLLTLGRPTRAAFPIPPGTVDLSGAGGDRAARAEAVARAARAFAADLVHAHLLDGDELARLSALGWPLLVTVHNMRPGWPLGLESLRPAGPVLLAACSQAVEADLRGAGLPIPVRTVWNGIDFAPFAQTPALRAAGEKIRRRHELGANDFVLLALANPRPQKRLHLLPSVLARTRAELARRGIHREARLLLAGEASRHNGAAVDALAAVRAEVARLELEAHVRFLGPAAEVAPLLAAADVLVSGSAYEGLSLAHLEALAAGLPVVATAAGGTAEIARDNPAVVVLPLEATAQEFAAALADIAATPSADGRGPAATHFSQARMIERYAFLYPRALEAARHRGPRDGLLLVINNFSTGGAQSSARRLLLGLAAEGVRVCAAVLEEEPAYPTVGRRALESAGVPVLVLPPSGTIDPARAVAILLERIDEDPPAAVLLWNAISEYKMLLADALLDVPLYDVSPGEMYFTSLERYLARPRPGLPYRTGPDYGARLAGVIVKYRAEAERAAQALGAVVYVIPNGVPLDGATGGGRRTEGRLVIGTVVRISPQKKLEELLTALRRVHERLPPYVLRIAGGVERGSAAYAEELRRLCVGLPVEWVGELDDPRPFLRELDLFALVAEPAGCPNASLEAMAQGLAMVATEVGGIAEQVADGVTGRLVPRGDVAALGEALVELMADPIRRAQWGAAGRARVVAHFDQKRMVADYRRICVPSADSSTDFVPAPPGAGEPAPSCSEVNQ